MIKIKDTESKREVIVAPGLDHNKLAEEIAAQYDTVVEIVHVKEVTAKNDGAFKKVTD